MSAKILPAIVAGLLLGTTMWASAQNLPNPDGGYEQDGMMPPGAYSQDPYAATSFEEMAPYSGDAQPDPYAGTAFDDVAPYTSR